MQSYGQLCFDRHVFYHTSRQVSLPAFQNGRGHDEQRRAIRSLIEGRSGSGKLMYPILCRRLQSETTRRDAIARWINTASQRLVQRHLQGMIETCNMDNRPGGFELVVPLFSSFRTVLFSLESLAIIDFAYIWVKRIT